MQPSARDRLARISPEASRLGTALHAGSPAEGILEATAPESVLSAVDEALGLLTGETARDRHDPVRAHLVDLLDAGRHPVFLRRITETPMAERWLELVERAIRSAGITLGDLFRLRVSQNPDRIQIHTPGSAGDRSLTRGQLGERVGHLAAGLIDALPAREHRVGVAVFAPNRLETILVDLACLTHGIVDVPIAADATPEHIHHILEQTRPPLLIVSDAKRLEAVVASGSLPLVETVILMDRPDHPGLLDQVRLLSDLEDRGREIGPVESLPIDPDDVATIMFTSGTTGRPKGIRFGHRNIVYKRFCRAVALPEIGEDDTFLCYLPLFHTFGRYLEMTGTLFWGAAYVLMENPSKEAMFQYMKRFQPSVFISIPKRWIQLYERILHLMGADTDDPAELDSVQLSKTAERVTGGRLRWGLSAAGHLDADIFQFFHRIRIELMSGFGMTEATGGITMTPPGRYRRGTVGIPLPGIEIRLAEDGELLCRGPYMLLGYDDEQQDRDFRKEWFATGDLFHIDPQGFYTIVDRKKDIYKNVKGQTIAPQKIENMFNQFEEIKRVFLVGDGREYNTLLIYPDYDVADGKLRKMSASELREYLSSYVVSVNRFLAPFERIVDFDLLPRFFREDKGELTPKGTFIRKAVERNFAETIESLYALAFVSVRVQGIEVRVPTWLLREKGVTAEGLNPEAGGIRLRHTGERLAIERIGGIPGRFRVGSFIYEIAGDATRESGAARVDLDPLLRVPRFWVGNAELAQFAGESLIQRARRGEISPPGIRVEGWLRPVLLAEMLAERFAVAEGKREAGPSGVHAAASLVFVTSDEEAALGALSLLEEFLEDPSREEATLVQEILPLLRHHPEATVRRRALSMLLPREVDERAAETLKSFLDADPAVLTGEVRKNLLQHELSAGVLKSFVVLARDLDAGVATQEGGRRGRITSMLRLVSDLGAKHPRWFASVRQVLVGRSITERDTEITKTAQELRERLEASFRRWIDTGPLEPIDRDSGQRIEWDQIVAFDERVEESVRGRLRDALRETTLLRTSTFLLCEGILLASEDLIPGGIWVSPLGAGHGKRVVRVTLRTRPGRTFEFVVKVMREIDPKEAAEEAAWMIRLGTRERKIRLVPEFGDFWPEHGLWSEEYISNETVLASLKRMTSGDDPERRERFVVLWPHFAWSALATFVEFWQRSGRSVVLAEPVPFNIVVAPHDYQEGSRIVSVSSRMPFKGIAEMIRFHYEGFVESTEKAFPFLKGGVDRKIAFASVMEALGEDVAIPLLWRALAEMRESMLASEDTAWIAWHENLAGYIEEVERDGFPPRRLVMAVRRYHTWARLNPGTSMQARAIMLHELYETYGFHDLEETHPEVRIRFFRLTVFTGATGPLETELEALIHTHRDSPLSLEALLRRMTILHRSTQLSEEELYFLARMTYAHLRPAQKAHLELMEEGETTAELVEETRDNDGVPLLIRGAANPKEVMRLHHLFEQAGMSVVFRPEHRFLVGVDEHGVVCGGLFYRPVDRSTAHMEKIVVGARHRRKGVGDRIMESFLERMLDDQKRKVTTGFFRPHYFYRFGFRLERGFAGLVRDLGPSESPGQGAPLADAESD